MSLDHEAIRKAYPNAVTIDDSKGAFDASGNSITLEQSKIDTARTELNTEAAAVKYKSDRANAFASIGDQLDMIYKDLLTGTFTTSGTWATHIKAVKDANPKPS